MGVFADGGFCFCGFVLSGDEVCLGSIGTHREIEIEGVLMSCCK